MAIVGSLFAVVGRFAGKVLNAALGWATILLFGNVEKSKQTTLALIGLGSLLWVALVLGVIFPDIGTFLIGFAPVPSFIDENIVRLAMLIGALVLPLVIGAAAAWMVKPEDRPKGAGLAKAVLRGYPFTLALAGTIAFLGVIAAFRKVQSLAKRWETAHVAVIVKPGHYHEVLVDLHGVLRQAGLEVEQEEASAVLSMPAKILEKAAGSGLGGLVPDRLMLLKAKDIEVLVYPSDVSIAGTEEIVARARAAIAAKLTDAEAYLTTSGDAQELEDEIREVADARKGVVPAVGPERLRQIDEKLANLNVPFDEWETVYRERLQVERDLLAQGRRASIAAAEVRAEPSRASGVEWMAAAIGLGLLALDVVLLVADRVAPPERRARRT